MRRMARRNKLMNLAVIATVGIMLGILFGYGVALAHTDIIWKVEGYHTYDTADENDPHKDCWIWECSWHERHDDAWASSNWEEFNIPNTAYTNGSSADGIVFGPLWIYDELGGNPQQFFNFVCLDIDGADYDENTYWYYGGHESPNYGTATEQYGWTDCSEPNNAGTHKMAMAVE